MTSLAHQCLLTLIKSQPCDRENPVIMDQVFDAEMRKMDNQRVINKLKKNIKKAKKKVHNMSGMRNIKLDVDNCDEVVTKLSHELFDNFSWNKIRNKNQTNWKEYFHNLYDLIVCDYDSDHPSNLIVAREIINYHHILKQPDEIDYNDKLYPVISTINCLFITLKIEQRKLADKLSNMKNIIRRTHKLSTEMQYDIIDWQSTVRILERENDVYYEIIKWSIDS
jgi:hypothetical protein